MKKITYTIASMILSFLFGAFSAFLGFVMISIIEKIFDLNLEGVIFYVLIAFFYGLFIFILYPNNQTLDLRIKRFLGLSKRAFIIAYLHIDGKNMSRGNYVLEADYPSLHYFISVIRKSIGEEGDILITMIYELNAQDVKKYQIVEEE